MVLIKKEGISAKKFYNKDQWKLFYAYFKILSMQIKSGNGFDLYITQLQGKRGPEYSILFCV